MKRLPLSLFLFLLLCLSCRQKIEQKQHVAVLKEKQSTVSLPDTIEVDSIYMYADLLYDSISYIVLENRSPLPITYDANFRFEQKTHGTWKIINVQQQDTARIVLSAGERDTLRMELAKAIGYQSLGPCRIYKTFRTLNGKQQFELKNETDARAHITDWSRVELVPDKTILNTTFVTMTAEVENRKIRVTLNNNTDKEITFGDATSFSLSVFQNNQWYALEYARLENSVAMILSPHGTIKDMPHELPGINYDFKPGSYRITKSFFFGADYKNKYVVGAEFRLVD